MSILKIEMIFLPSDYPIYQKFYYDYDHLEFFVQLLKSLSLAGRMESPAPVTDTVTPAGGILRRGDPKPWPGHGREAHHRQQQARQRVLTLGNRMPPLEGSVRVSRRPAPSRWSAFTHALKG